MAPPTDYNTIYTTLLRNKEIANSLGYKHLPIFFDMGLLTKALEITWAQPEVLQGIYPCEGGMHLLMAVMAAIGHLYGSAGIHQLLHDSGVFAAGTAHQILAGKDFDRGLYALKLVDEVLNSLFLREFEVWCKLKHAILPPQFTGVLEELLHECNLPLPDTSKTASLLDELEEVVEKTLLPLLEQFRKEGRSASATFVLWDDFLQRVTLPLKMFLAATRKGDWQVYQSTKAQFLPLLFAGNRTTYARYMPFLLMAMKRLPKEISDAFMQQGFIAKLSQGRFNGVWIDYALEATENKDLKGSGGIIGLTLKGPALARWFLARPVTARYSATFRQSIHASRKEDTSESHHCTRNSEVNRWEKNVSKMKSMFESGTFVNPFQLSEVPDRLINFATGAVATPDIEESLVDALNKGERLAETFVEERLVGKNGKPPNKSFHDPMKRASVKTMDALTKTVNIKSRNVSVPGEVMYLRLLAINNQKQVPLERVMGYENSAVPLSMFTNEGLMLSGNKSVFLHKLEGLIHDEVITDIPEADAIITDANAILHVLRVPDTKSSEVTYDDMAALFLRYLLASSRNTCGHGLSQIHTVFDKYDVDSPKTEARGKRAKGRPAILYHVTPEASVPKDWKSFLSREENKTALVKCYTNHFKEKAKANLNAGEQLFVSGGNDKVCNIISKEQSEEDKEDLVCEELHSNHEEADTRIVCHAIYAAKAGAQTIVIQSPDTDILVLLLHHRSAIPAKNIFFSTGHEGKHTSMKRFIPVHTLYKLISPCQIAVLLSIYTLTGCDTVSFFFGHGKATAFQLMQKHAEQLQDLEFLGSTSDISPEQQAACSKFVSLMYGHTSDSLNAVRCKMARSKKRQIVGKKLPPTEDSFFLHVKRTVYQLRVWRQAHLSIVDKPEPTEYGYEKDAQNRVSPKMMSQEPCAPELLNDFLCECPPKECNASCICFKNAQPCTAACVCKAALAGPEESSPCANSFTTEALVYNSESEEE